MEQWRDVVGYEGVYEVSNIGNVRTAAEAGRALGIRSASDIGACCRQYRGRKTFKGFIWRYKGGDNK